jgi:rubrerythrin
VTNKTVTDKLGQAKQAVRLAKAELKKARKRYKAAKKAAKLSRKVRKPAKVRKPVKAPATARPAVKVAPKTKPRVKAAAPVEAKVAKRVVPKRVAQKLRSTEEVTKTVIERLQNPPPALPPDPVIPEN